MLYYLEKLMSCTNQSLVREATWCMSNIAAGNEQQIQLLLNEGIVPIIEEMIVMSRKDIQKEACWTICNIVCGGSMQQVKSLIQQYDVPQMVSKLVNSDSEDRLLMIIMDTLDRLLAAGEQMQVAHIWDSNHVEDQIQESGILDSLESMSMSDTVCQRVKAFVAQHYGFEDEDDFSFGPM